MEILKGSTTKGQNIIARYNRYEGVDLDDVYGRYSSAKSRAWRECYDWYVADNESTNFHICSHSDQSFSVGWEYVDKETGHRIIRVETSRYTYRVDTEV